MLLTTITMTMSTPTLTKLLMPVDLARAEVMLTWTLDPLLLLARGVLTRWSW